MKTFDQLVNSDAIQAMNGYVDGFLTISQAVFQLAALDIHVRNIEWSGFLVTWVISSYSDEDSLSVDDVHAGKRVSQFEYTTTSE